MGSDVMGNLEKPKSAADELALWGAEQLDADKWENLTEYRLRIDHVQFWIANGEAGLSIEVGAIGTALAEVRPSPAYCGVFWDSYTRFTAREIERRAQAKLNSVRNLAAHRSVPWWKFWRGESQ